MRWAYSAWEWEWVTITMVVPSSFNCGQKLHHFLAIGGVEIAGRLVGQDQLGPRHDGAGDGDALLLAARKLARACAARGGRIFMRSSASATRFLRSAAETSA